MGELCRLGDKRLYVEGEGLWGWAKGGFKGLVKVLAEAY